MSKRIFDYFFHQVTLQPQGIALIEGSKEYSFQQLWDQVKEISGWIKENAAQNHLLGIEVQNDAWSYAALLAASMCNQTFIPLAKDWPEARKNEIIGIASIETMLTKAVVTQGFWNEERLALNNESAYLLFTSGTTGSPKGMVLKHDQINAFIKYYLNESTYQFSNQDRFQQTFDLTFDFAGFAYLMAFSTGGTLVLSDQKNQQKLFSFISSIQNNEATVVAFVPSILQFYKKYMKDIQLPSLRYCLFGGAPLFRDLALDWKKCIPNGAIRNVYGPTETTIICSDYEWSSDKNESLNNVEPLGKLFPSFEYILMKDGVVSENEGELCLAGPQVIDQYFYPASPDQFVMHHDQKYYRTGDYVCLEGGLFKFIKRIDLQVKVNGYRIELNEIENLVEKISGLKSVALKIAQYGMEFLVVIVEGDVNTYQLKLDLRNQLPEYCWPKQIFVKEALPLNSNQKFDRNQLEEWVQVQMIH